MEKSPLGDDYNLLPGQFSIGGHQINYVFITKVDSPDILIHNVPNEYLVVKFVAASLTIRINSYVHVAPDHEIEQQNIRDTLEIVCSFNIWKKANAYLRKHAEKYKKLGYKLKIVDVYSGPSH